MVDKLNRIEFYLLKRCTALTPKRHENGKEDRWGIIEEVGQSREETRVSESCVRARLVAQRAHRNVPCDEEIPKFLVRSEASQPQVQPVNAKVNWKTHLQFWSRKFPWWEYCRPRLYYRVRKKSTAVPRSRGDTALACKSPARRSTGPPFRRSNGVSAKWAAFCTCVNYQTVTHSILFYL